jgi:hypothetical protein
MAYLIGAMCLAMMAFLVGCVVLVVRACIRTGTHVAGDVKTFVQYWHHKAKVWVREDLKDRHRDHCLCHSCKRFYPGSQGNCPIAQKTYENCVDQDIVTPMWECPHFEQDPDAAIRSYNQ